MNLQAATGEITTFECVEGPTKSRQEGLNKRPRMVTQKLYRTGGQRCPVAAYELLLSKHPAELKDHGPLYLERKDSGQSLQSGFQKPPMVYTSSTILSTGSAVDADLDVTKKHYTNYGI